MKNLTTAFSMVWGNFTVLPCPYKRWDSKLNNMMLALLPVVGAVIGGLWVLLVWVLQLAEVPVQLQALAATFYIFAVCGFMHMDGYMDCNDAILSRRPLEERQRILKDPTVGSFAVVTLVFLVLAFYVAMEVVLAGPGAGCGPSVGLATGSTAAHRAAGTAATTAHVGASPNTLFASLFLIPVVSRTMAGSGVMEYEPIGHSQYKKSFEAEGKGRYKVAMLLTMVVFVAAATALAGPPYTDALLPALVTAAAALLAMWHARRWLGGMSGDIAGYAICWSELAGVICLALEGRF